MYMYSMVAAVAATWQAGDAVVEATASWRHHWSLTDSPSNCQYFHSLVSTAQHPQLTSHSSIVCSVCNNQQCQRFVFQSLLSLCLVITSPLPLPSARQHPSYGGCLEDKRKYYQNSSSMLDCVTQCSQSAALMWAVLTGPTDWVCDIGTLMLCTEAVAWSCIIVTWWSSSGGIQAWSRRPAGFFQCFDTVGLVIWPVKIVPKMTNYVSSGTLNPVHSLTHISYKMLSRWWYS